MSRSAIATLSIAAALSIASPGCIPIIASAAIAEHANKKQDERTAGLTETMLLAAGHPAPSDEEASAIVAEFMAVAKMKPQGCPADVAAVACSVDEPGGKVPATTVQVRPMSEWDGVRFATYAVKGKTLMRVEWVERKGRDVVAVTFPRQP